jgi:phosphatidylglycerol:prolipoprotein diacylglycerol transferase
MLQVFADFGEIDLLGRTFHLRIYGYGLMMVLGFLCGIYLARWRARRFGENPDRIFTLGLLALVGGVVGARLAYVIEKWDAEFAQAGDPLVAMLDITSGGLIYYGGVALAVALVTGYLAVKRLSVRRFLDILAPSLMIGLAFGRVGCLMNGCCYGGLCHEDYPLAMRFPYASRPLLDFSDGNVFGSSSVSPPFAHQMSLPPEEGGLDVDELPPWLLRRTQRGTPILNGRGRPLPVTPSDLTAEQARQAVHIHSRPLQPAQVFGIINALLIAGILLAFSRLRTREGQVFLLMLVLYPITRFILESIRGDNPHGLLRLQLTHNQWISIGTVIAALILWRLLRLWPAAARSPRLTQDASPQALASNPQANKGR